MTILAAVVLALAVGVTELLPVSGTGHLYILAELLGVPCTGAVFGSFRAMLYFGAAFAGILFYRTQLGDMAGEGLALLGLARPRTHLRGEPFGRRLGLLLAVGAAPMLPALLLNGLRKKLEQGDYALAVVCVLLCLSGVILYLTARGARGKRTIHQMTLADAVTAGLVQVLAVLPGLSRLSLTLAALLGRGLDGEAAAEFTGLLGVPVLFGAGLVQILEAAGSEEPMASAPYLILAFALAALAGFFTLQLYTERMARRRPTGFAYCSWGAGILALILFLISA